MKEFENHDLYQEELQQFKFQSNKLLAKILKYAINGDMKAARLYFEVVNGIGAKSARTEINTTITTQNNYLQLNGKIISQQTILNLPKEQQKQLEAIFSLNP